MLHKSFEILETKADGESGEFTALVSTFGNVDKVGDRIVKGAYAKTLAKWRSSGDPLPIILAHQWNDVMAHVGYADAEDVTETDRGLLVKGRLDVEDNPIARQVHKLMKRRTLKEFSIGYSVPTGGEKRAKDGANEISEIELAECGPCLKGIDPKTELQGVKSALGVQEPPDAEAQRRESARIERELNEERVAAIPAPDRVVVEPEPAAAKDIIALAAALPDDDKRAVKNAIVLPEPIDPETQRKESQRLEREIVETQLPDVPEQPRAPVEPEVDLAKELQEVKSQLAETRQLLEDLKKKAEETDKEPQARSVDPLRKRSEELALEITSDGMSLRRPPTKVPEPEPDLIPLGELKRRSRDLMTDLLSRDLE